MRILALLVALLALPLHVASAQNTDPPEGATITSAQVSGLDLARLSPGLQREIANLAGAPLDRERLKALAARIEEEHPRYVAAVRAIQAPEGEVHVFFVVARLGERGRQDNVNDRYVIERADIRGVRDRDMTQAVRDDLQALAGKRPDSEEAERLEHHLEEALPRYDINRRIVRGSQPGQIVVVFEAIKNESSRWLHFEPTQTNVVYHSDQGWGSFLDLPIGGRDIRFTPSFAIDVGDDLIEEYSGYGLRFETRKMGTDRLGASLAWTSYDQDWNGATLAALAANPRIPGPYDTRSTITPLIKFALTPDLSVSAGVGITELEDIPGYIGSQMSNAVLLSLAYDRRWKDRAGANHGADLSFGFHTGTRSLESDLVYHRYLAEGRYRYDRGRHHLRFAGMAGGLNGEAPLFERFSLGDSTTLRGWDKYDIAPAGGDRMFHSSLEYRFSAIAMFLDTGAVWDRDAQMRVRVSTGLGFNPGPLFFTVGFPLNTDNMSAVFTMGIRLSDPGYKK